MSNPNRVPEGSPEGGQFARGGAKPESTQTIADREWENRAGLSASEVLEACRRLGLSHAAKHPGLDADEIASRTLLEFAESAQEGKRPIQSPRGLLKVKARSMAVQANLGTSRGPDITAMTMYLTRRGEWESEHGTSMPESRQERLHDEIRAEIIASGKQAPTKNFHRRTSAANERSLDALMTDDDGRTREFVPGAATHHSDIDPAEALDSERVDSVIDELSARMAATAAGTADRRDGARAVQVRAWNILAENEGAPPAATEHLSSAQAKWHAKTIKEAGGARVLARKILDGDATREQTRAFAAPFGASARAPQVNAAAELVARHNSGDVMWRALNESSSSPRHDERATWTPAEANTFRSTVTSTSTGGPRRAANAALRGQATPETLRPLLAPWRHASPEQRQVAMQQLAACRSDAEAREMWDAQMHAITAPGVRKTSKAS